MAVHVVKVPDIGEGVAEVELVVWRVKPGDTVAEDQSLVDVMTDKATVEIPSPVAGKVLALGGAAGEVLAVGSELIRIEVEDGAKADGAADVKSAKVETRVTQPPADSPSGAGKDSIEPPAAIAKPALDRATHGAALAQEAQSSATARAAKTAPDRAGASGAGRPIASPAVRRRAWELGVELADVKPGGSAGRIMQADLDAYLAKHPRTDRAPADRPADRYARASGEEPEAVTGLRRRIAQKMQEAKRRIPHFSYIEEIDVTELEALREGLNAQHDGTRPRLTLLPFLLRAVVLAVADFPSLNARFDDESGHITRYRPVHAGIATQTDAGLMVPVLRHAEALDLWQAAQQIAALADKARAGKATRDELTGSTITVTSLGALGGIASTPVINRPEVAIVGVNRIALRPVMLHGAVVARRMMNLSSSFDHRVVDGLVAARFVHRIKDLLEQPALLFVA